MKTVKNEIQKIGEGTFQIIESFLWSGMDAGVQVIDKLVEWKTTVYETPELANIAASNEKERWGSNLVCLGNETVEYDGKKYYHPTFNVFD